MIMCGMGHVLTNSPYYFTIKFVDIIFKKESKLNLEIVFPNVLLKLSKKSRSKKAQVSLK